LLSFEVGKADFKSLFGEVILFKLELLNMFIINIFKDVIAVR